MAIKGFISWSASRLDDHTLCPRMAMHKHLDKLCPTCFKGSINKGKYPNQVCSYCGKPRPTPPAMARGGEVGKTLEEYVNGAAKKLHPEITNTEVLSVAKKLRASFKKGTVTIERMLNFDRDFKLLGEGWSPDIWLIVKMDVWEVVKNVGKVLDWKTGGIDKRTGEIRAQGKYDHQLDTYKVAGLCAYPEVDLVNASLGFVDAAETALGRPQSAFVGAPPLARKDLSKAQQALRKLSLPILTDRVFAPRPNDRCRWCDYSKGKGGPCPY